METKEKKQMPSKSIKVKIGQNEYSINFPNNGQLIEIERRKIAYTNGTHKEMLMGLAAGTQQAYMLVEAISVYSVMIPELQKDLNVGSLLELDPYQSKGMVNEYVTKFYPWFNDWMNFINEKEEE